MTRDELLDLFRKSGALLEGHFRLSSGLHSTGYLQCALVLQQPDAAETLGRAIADRTRDWRPTVVLSPALGGVVIGHEVGRALGVRALFAERQDGQLMLRRGFVLGERDRVLVIEDVLTTGKSTRETMQVARAAGAQVVGAASIVDRSGGRGALRRAVCRAVRRRAADIRARRMSAVRSGRPGGEARIAARRRMTPLMSHEGHEGHRNLQSVFVLFASSWFRSMVSMPTFKITVAYDGTGFVGWQRQAQGTSIQGLLEDALRVLDGRDVTVHGAGRTDAGVHALGQVASFTLERAIDAGGVLRATNAQLPAAIRVVRAEAVDPTFHARRSARAKTYGYRILNSDVPDVFERAYVWHVPGALDFNAMQAAARQLEGRHDFAAFQASGAATKTTEREVSVDQDFHHRGHGGHGGKIGEFSSRVLGGGALITIEITGTGFLRHMVRIIVGSLVEIGRGRRDAAWLGRVLASRDRTLAGPTAPPSGLFLLGVAYPSDVLADEC